MSWFGLIAGGFAVGFIIFVAICLFIVGARDENDKHEEEPGIEKRKKHTAAKPARRERKKKLH